MGYILRNSQGKFVLSTEKTDSPQRTRRTQRKTLMLFLCILCGEKGFIFMDTPSVSHFSGGLPIIC